MSDVLAMAMYRAKTARQTPQVVNVWQGNVASERELAAARKHICELQQQNLELRGRIGGLTTQIASLTKLYGSEKAAKESLIASIDTKAAYRPLLSMSDITIAVSAEFGIHLRDIKSEFRSKSIVLARQAAMYLCRLLTGKAINAVARQFNRDHSTIIHAIEKIQETRKIDAELNAKLERIEAQFLQPGGAA